MPETATQKNDLRRKLLADRQAITSEVRMELDSAICAHVIAWWERIEARELGIYWPIRGEPDLRPAYELLSGRGVRLALPVVVDRNSALQFIEWKPGVEMAKDAFGVSIPVSGEILRPEALLIPCVGFNRQRYRLGYGGGFYDRTLALSPRPMTVGICYSSALSHFESDSHDIPLDEVITEVAG